MGLFGHTRLMNRLMGVFEEEGYEVLPHGKMNFTDNTKRGIRRGGSVQKGLRVKLDVVVHPRGTPEGDEERGGWGEE